MFLLVFRIDLADFSFFNVNFVDGRNLLGYLVFAGRVRTLHDSRALTEQIDLLLLHSALSFGLLTFGNSLPSGSIYRRCLKFFSEVKRYLLFFDHRVESLDISVIGGARSRWLLLRHKHLSLLSLLRLRVADLIVRAVLHLLEALNIVDLGDHDTLLTVLIVFSEQLVGFFVSQRHLVLRNLIDGAIEVFVEQTRLADLILVELEHLQELHELLAANLVINCLLFRFNDVVLELGVRDARHQPLKVFLANLLIIRDEERRGITLQSSV